MIPLVQMITRTMKMLYRATDNKKTVTEGRGGKCLNHGGHYRYKGKQIESICPSRGWHAASRLDYHRYVYDLLSTIYIVYDISVRVSNMGGNA